MTGGWRCRSFLILDFRPLHMHTSMYVESPKSYLQTDAKLQFGLKPLVSHSLTVAANRPISLLDRSLCQAWHKLPQNQGKYSYIYKGLLRRRSRFFD